MRTPIVAGNWKCHKTAKEARELARDILGQLGAIRGVDVVLCPPFTALSAVAAALQGTSIGLGAQDVYWEPQGAFTGEISAPMLVEAGCTYCIIGHSERRQHFGETDESVNKKVAAALRDGLIPIVCVGETLQQREAGQTFEVVRRQLEGGLKGLKAQDVGRLVIAYEPVWAIGTGRNATPAQAQEAQQFIRQRIAEAWGPQVAKGLRIQYGGSVNAANALEILQQPDIDGALVGGASLKAEAFVAIVNAAAEVTK